MSRIQKHEDNLSFIIKYENENDRQKTYGIFWISNKNKYNNYIYNFIQLYTFVKICLIYIYLIEIKNHLF